ncbi:hypothetical protein LVW35_16385 [Pseudomonas sp. HN11]|uniref:hypothetical protein n=1 Tax=Pseudomonas sp. HN11 TaxID=1344094 RepID=UPI001F44875D|nr:hypothetical protein [Pseudomonas sp. HN11]UII69265.1 hypothetical protein LVW35_16385 [Pseudomonas sp. HN11]
MPSTQRMVIQGINGLIGLSSLRWLRQRTPLKCRRLRAGHDAFDPMLTRAIQHSLVAAGSGQ